jgi:two-component system, sensor histidine kinase PdtaS
MDRMIRTAQRWPMWARVMLTVVAVIVAYLVQVPLEREIPGEPFLLFSLVVICAALAFGSIAGFVAVGLSTLLLIPFFDPFGSWRLTRVWDLINIELYAILGAGCVFAVTRLRDSLIATSETNEALERADKSRSLLLRETTHGVANNFAAVVALLSMKSRSVEDIRARRTLDEAVEQVRVMARVHRRLRAHDHHVSLDGAAYLHELCKDLEDMVSGRPLVIECDADSRPLYMQQAVLLGLIVNELVTNAVKHAFPDGRAGRVRVSLKALTGELRLSVEDDGVGFGNGTWNGTDMGQGQELVRGLAHELDGNLEIESTARGSSIRLRFPLTTPGASTTSVQSAAFLH